MFVLTFQVIVTLTFDLSPCNLKFLSQLHAWIYWESFMSTNQILRISWSILYCENGLSLIIARISFDDLDLDLWPVTLKFELTICVWNVSGVCNFGHRDVNITSHRRRNVKNTNLRRTPNFSTWTGNDEINAKYHVWYIKRTRLGHRKIQKYKQKLK